MTRNVEIREHIELLQHEGDRFERAITGADPGTPVPSCPEWNLRDLVHHLGAIHRWAAATVREARPEPIRTPLEQLAGPWPDDAELIEWFRAGHTALVQTLTTTDPDVDCWTFLPAPSPLAFWARRQAQETGLHRADAESAVGPITPFAPEPAADGIDELLRGFGARRGRYPLGDAAPRLQVIATDAGREWLVQLGPDHIEVLDPVEGGASDCTVEGSASDLLLVFWNRAAPDVLRVSGDPAALDLWREAMRI